MHNPSTGELIVDDYASSVGEVCPNCGNINDGIYCNKCGTNKITIRVKADEMKNESSFFNKILGREKN